ncbi:MAG: hypothetical protein Q9197_006625 [Variospora fuerteventurae]
MAQVKILLLELEGVKPRKLQTALHAAIEKNQSSVVSLLMSRGIWFDWISFRMALRNENIAILQAFFDHWGGLNRQVLHTMRPPLAHAVGNHYLVHWFLDHGADPNASRKGEPSPMHVAAMSVSLPTIRLLRRHGGRVIHGVLQSAATTSDPGRVEILEYLLEEGALIDEVEYEWDPLTFKKLRFKAFGTALHHAAKKGNLEMVLFLLAKGARQDIEDSLGRKPIQYAQQFKHDKITVTLRQYQTGYFFGLGVMTHDPITANNLGLASDKQRLSHELDNASRGPKSQITSLLH